MIELQQRTAGPPGLPGAPGIQGEPSGATILNGNGAPSNALGVTGDYYIDNTAKAIHGPKDAGVWPAGVALIGPTGPTGPAGATGAAGPAGAAGATGPAGSSVLNGTGAPSNALGANGDYYINNANLSIHGPKAAGVWPAGTSLRANRSFLSTFTIGHGSGPFTGGPTQINRLVGGSALSIPATTPLAGSIVGLALASQLALTAGTIVYEVYKNGVATGFTVTQAIGSPQYVAASQAAGLDTFAAADRLDVRYTSTAHTFAGSSNVLIDVLVEYT